MNLTLHLMKLMYMTIREKALTLLKKKKALYVTFIDHDRHSSLLKKKNITFR